MDKQMLHLLKAKLNSEILFKQRRVYIGKAISITLDSGECRLKDT